LKKNTGTRIGVFREGLTNQELAFLKTTRERDSPGGNNISTDGVLSPSQNQCPHNLPVI